MLPVKWKLYRVLNYLLLCGGIFFFLVFVRLILNGIKLIKSGVHNKTGYDERFLTISFLLSLIFLFIATHSLINIILMSKTFPDKIFTRHKNRWYIVSLILNSISSLGLLISFFSLLSEFDDAHSGELLTMFVFSILLLSSLFVLICQFNLRKYVRQRNALLMNSFIDSIGDKSEGVE